MLLEFCSTEICLLCVPMVDSTSVGYEPDTFTCAILYCTCNS